VALTSASRFPLAYGVADARRRLPRPFLRRS
jgi:hypothetical protein